MLYCKICTWIVRTAEPCFTFLLGLIKNGEITETGLIVGLVLYLCDLRCNFLDPVFNSFDDLIIVLNNQTC